MKKTILSRLYSLDIADQRHELTATNAADLAAQVQAITGRKQAGNMARSVWGDEAANIQASGMRLIATGAVVREVWRTLPALKGSEKAKEAEATQAEAEQSAASAEEPPSEL